MICESCAGRKKGQVEQGGRKDRLNKSGEGGWGVDIGGLAAEFLPEDRFRLGQNGSDALTGKKRTLGKSLGVTAITVILGVSTRARTELSSM
jgi:hypothetical protein